MNDIESTRTEILEFLTGMTSTKNSAVSILKNSINQSNKKTTTSQKVTNKSDENEDYGMSLKSFTNLNSYLTVMNSLYGNTSQSKFKMALQNVLNAGQNTQIANAKTFVEKMKENGLSTTSAAKMYKAINSYSLVSNLQNDNVIGFVSANI